VYWWSSSATDIFKCGRDSLHTQISGAPNEKIKKIKKHFNIYHIEEEAERVDNFLGQVSSSSFFFLFSLGLV
jgi:hypothetical protein